ncbi:CatB-related O-acetyltransferase [Lutispora sp.]|uniref:xenobiotic acyltransferase family protein n=1 Tax=Lutispora sp. TaxID=2828727 RepID=UPI0035692473
MNESNYVSSDAVITDSKIGDKVKIYKNAEVRKSSLEEYVSIGDQTIVLNSNIKNNSSINRRNYIYRSSIGSYTYTGIGSMIRSAEIGNFCSISWNVSVGGGNHQYNNVTTSPLWRFHMMDSFAKNPKTDIELSKTFNKQAPCIIGNDVWIGTNAVILRDISIGNGAIIGAGAIVTKDVEPYSIVAGVPARVIKKRFDDKTIELLEKIQWWSWPKEIIRDNLELIYSSAVDDNVIEKLMQISNSIDKENLEGV